MCGRRMLLQAIPARMSCKNGLEWVGGAFIKQSKNLDHNCGLQGGKRRVHFVGRRSDGEAVMDPVGAKSVKVSMIMTMRGIQQRQPLLHLWPTACTAGWEEQGKEGDP